VFDEDAGHVEDEGGQAGEGAHPPGGREHVEDEHAVGAGADSVIPFPVRNLRTKLKLDKI
jgi:hypothetical protein